MQPLLINKATVEKFLQVAIGYSPAEFDRYIREAQEFDFKPLVCEDFYYDLLNKKDLDPYDKILTGHEYPHNDKIYYHQGLKAVLSYFTYARFILKSAAVSTSHGIVQKTTPNSQPLSPTEKKDMYHSHRQDAHILFEGVVKYMDRKNINYKDCYGCEEIPDQDIVIRAPRMVAIEFIQGVSTFKINNITLIRNFHSYVSGNKLRIVNAYDTRNQLLPYTSFTEISVNGVVYASVVELAEVLVPILFLKQGGSDTGSSVPTLSGNIITKIVQVPIDWNQNPEDQIVSFVNSQSFVVLGTQRILFKAVRITGDVNNNNSSETYFWEFKPGKGNYGVGGTNISLAAIEYFSFITNAQNNAFDIGEIGIVPIEVFVNNTGPYTISASKLNIFKALRNAVPVNYIYIGNENNIGDGESQTINSDFLDVNATPVQDPSGVDGKSAYEIALDFGFVGTEVEWFASLEGSDGRSAYQVALDNGFVGTESEWLETLGGIPGFSAYEVAVDNGFVGTVQEWLDSLKGDKGDPGNPGAPGEPGQDGNDGLSAYQIAVNNGFIGTQAEWLLSLEGEPGPPGSDGEVTTQQLNDALTLKVDKINGKGLSTNDLTNELKAAYDLAAQPSQVTKTTTTSITSETLSDGNYSQNGKNVLIANSTNAINITVGATANFIASYQKEGTGAITFLASSGKTIRAVDGTNILNGVVGSTATVSVVGTVVSLRISNAV